VNIAGASPGVWHRACAQDHTLLTIFHPLAIRVTSNAFLGRHFITTVLALWTPKVDISGLPRDCRLLRERYN
jgi:hypothetical protein